MYFVTCDEVGGESYHPPHLTVLPSSVILHMIYGGGAATRGTSPRGPAGPLLTHDTAFLSFFRSMVTFVTLFTGSIPVSRSLYFYRQFCFG